MINKPERWSETVEDYYPVEPRPRWGHGAPPNSYLKSVLDSGRLSYFDSLREIGEHRDMFHQVQHRTPPERLQPSWDNYYFSVFDAVSLMGFLLSRKPQRYTEVGSGHSTLFARFSIAAGALPTRVTSIDPEPRRDIDRLCDEIIRAPLERCSAEPFLALKAGDILFFDGSHRVFTNSDVTTLFFDIIPALAPGVIIHFHDIFLPDDYPPVWNGRLYSEQYLLGAMLLCHSRPFRVLLPNYYVCTDSVLSDEVRKILASKTTQRDIPFRYFENESGGFPGVSFWIETVGAGDTLPSS
jgi:hypothetical protein